MGTATGMLPRVETVRVIVPNASAAADADTPILVMPFTGTVTGVNYIPKTTLTGANTESRTCSLRNKAADGSGSTTVATLAFTSGVNATAFDATAITLSGTAANLDVTEGQVLAWYSLHVGSTGLADPGGLLEVTISRD